MTKSISVCSLIASLAVMMICAIYKPAFLNDQNAFLHHFIDKELLGLLVIIITITLASAASLHLEFNKIEEQFKKRGLTKTRHGVRQGAYCLIVLFLIAIVLVVVKPLIPHSEVGEALFNGFGLLILFWNVLILLELTQLAFAIEPRIEDD